MVPFVLVQSRFARGCLDAGGSPAASCFLCSAKESNPHHKGVLAGRSVLCTGHGGKKGRPAAPPLRAKSHLPEKIGRAPKLGLRPQTSAPDFPRFFREGETGQREGEASGSNRSGLEKTAPGAQLCGEIHVTNVHYWHEECVRACTKFGWTEGPQRQKRRQMPMRKTGH